MSDETKLELLKTDLQITAERYDLYLTTMLSLAAAAIGREGITLMQTIEDDALVVQYAAYLYRKRREQETSMPRYLRWMLNNRLLSQQMGGAVNG